ncbi:MAG: family 65 glycosyl hydrolase domain-containing protein [Bacillota bacterium]|nr:family 65 glycosyl hydrolase domain-containing protein [Bacillota bacterium]
MRSNFVVDPWKVIQTAFVPENQRFAESLMSLGNGIMGMRGNFEETYSGDTHQGTYIGGVWFPDKTRVGWWKNGYPRYFGKVINAMNLIGLEVMVDQEKIDAGKLEVINFYRELDMFTGILRREMTVKTDKGLVKINAERFVSMADSSCVAIRYEVTPDYEAEVRITAFLDGNVKNEDSNYEETFWVQEDGGVVEHAQGAYLVARTKENPFGTPRFTVAAAFRVLSDMEYIEDKAAPGYVSLTFLQNCQPGEKAGLDKIINVATDRDYDREELFEVAKRLTHYSAKLGYEGLKYLHATAWEKKWETADVTISGDEEAQQGIRFNLFHLLCTYTGDDARLNIGPKGFTGEKYGGATYWDTEAYCFPVYMATAGEHIARQLLLYRHQQLDGAYHNARQQGLPGALYPMVTFNGIECHNEWEITFMELHRNGAIAHAIFDYTTYTGDESYLLNEGLEVLLGIARFWVGRVHFNDRTGLYMIHGVTGPNEYENNVNNNWYTNRIAAWCLDYFLQAWQKASEERKAALHVSEDELRKMREISDNMYYPLDEERGIFVQHDTFLDKVLMPASQLPQEERPLNQHWSWDRILRSCFIKQADVLQGLYFLGHLYDRDAKKRNFDFYEPMTVHESSLSPCVHAILAAEIGYENKAVELYHRTARLDLDNINNDTEDGLHITSMSGSWLVIAQGFAGMRTVDGLSFWPFLPSDWTGYAFRFEYRGRTVNFEMHEDTVTLTLLSGEGLNLKVWDEDLMLTDTWSKRSPDA